MGGRSGRLGSRHATGRLPAGFVGNRCGPVRFDRDYWGDDETIAIYIPISPRGRSVGDFIRINADAVALLAAANGGGLTLERTVDLIRSGHAESLVDQPEGSWFDGKRSPYRLGEEQQKWELAEDIASFANSSAGGVILLGARTRSTPNGDVVEAITHFELGMLKAQSYHPLIMSRVHPAIEGLDVRTVEYGDGRGVGYIHVPPQPAERRPFLRGRGALLGRRIQTPFVSIPHEGW